jgi:hypothetical protein
MKDHRGSPVVLIESSCKRFISKTDDCIESLQFTYHVQRRDLLVRIGNRNGHTFFTVLGPRSHLSIHAHAYRNNVHLQHSGVPIMDAHYCDLQNGTRYPGNMSDETGDFASS